ncbi:MAG: hypothetical protein WAV40_04875 [Microgenomates group bacterium]
MSRSYDAVEKTYSLGLNVTGEVEDLNKIAFPGVEVPLDGPDIKHLSDKAIRSLGYKIAKLAIQSGLLEDPLFIERGIWDSISLSLITHYNDENSTIGASLIGGIYPTDKDRLLMSKVNTVINSENSS